MFDRYAVTPIIALGLAFLVWVYLRSRDQEVQTYPVPLEMSIGVQQLDRFAFETKPADKVRVKFYGLPSRLREVKNMVDQDELKLRCIVKVPSEVDQRQENIYKDWVQLDASSLLNLPLGVHAEITPAEGRLAVNLKRMMEKVLQVQLLAAPGNEQYEIDQQRVEPSTVKVFGPKSVLENQTQIILDRWQPKRIPLGMNFAPEDISETLRIPTKINDIAVSVLPETVEVRARLKPALRVYELVDVPVHFMCPSNFPFRPIFTLERNGVLPELKVRGPHNKSPEIRAYVDLTKLTNPKPVLYADMPIMLDLPDGYQLISEAPRVSAFKLELLESNQKILGSNDH
jgi:hypothetical protein